MNESSEPIVLTAPRHDIPAGGRSGFTMVGGMQFHFLEWGHAKLPPVVCLHGGGQTAYMYEELGAAIGRDHHVLAPDLPGHGDSDTLPDLISRHAVAETIPALAAQMGIERAVLVGASFGGLVSITLGAAKPDFVEAIALIDVGHQLEEEGVQRIIEFMGKHESFGSLEEAAEAIREYLPHRRNVTSERLTRNLRKRDDGRWVWKHRMRSAQQLQARGNWRDILSGLDDDARTLACPVLVLRGAKSDVLSDRGAGEIASIIPDARVATVADAGHLAAGDNPESTVQLIAGFLREIGW
jgi:pimeloyl-ACP methyl ester carboxylesterase